MAPLRSGSAFPASLVRTFLLVVAIICWAAPAHADQSQSFVWLADTRGDANDDIIDKSVLTPIVDRILAMSPAPKVVIFGGDAAYRGGTDNLTEFQKVFTDRLDAAGIPSAYAIGNHELYTTGSQSHGRSTGETSRNSRLSLTAAGRRTALPVLTIWPSHSISAIHSSSLPIVFTHTQMAVMPAYGINQAQQRLDQRPSAKQ